MNDVNYLTDIINVFLHTTLNIVIIGIGRKTSNSDLTAMAGTKQCKSVDDPSDTLMIFTLYLLRQF